MPLAAVALWFFADRGPDSDQESACHCTSAASESEARPQRPAAGQRARRSRFTQAGQVSAAASHPESRVTGTAPASPIRPFRLTSAVWPHRDRRRPSAAGRRRELDCEGPAPRPGLKVTVQAQALGRPGDSVTSSRRGPEPPARLGGPAAAAELEACLRVIIARRHLVRRRLARAGRGPDSEYYHRVT